MKAIILAAGYAMRLYPLTKDRPKALLPIGGRAMLDYLLDGIAQIPEIDEVFLISNHRFAGQFEDWAIGARDQFPHLALHVLDDGTDTNDNRLGAVGDIQFVIEKSGLDDDVLIAASDNFFTFPLEDFIQDFRDHGRDTLLGKQLGYSPELSRFAIATLDEEGRVTSLIEKPENPASDIAIFAMYLYRRETLKLFRQYLDEGNNPDAPGHFPEWLYRRQEVGVHLFQGDCVDIGTPQAYQEVCRQFDR